MDDATRELILVLAISLAIAGPAVFAAIVLLIRVARAKSVPAEAVAMFVGVIVLSVPISFAVAGLVNSSMRWGPDSTFEDLAAFGAVWDFAAPALLVAVGCLWAGASLLRSRARNVRGT